MNELNASPRITSARCSSSWEGVYNDVSRCWSWSRWWINETAFGTFCLSAGLIRDSTTFSLRLSSRTRWERRWFLLTTVVWTSSPSRLRKRVANPMFVSVFRFWIYDQYILLKMCFGSHVMVTSLGPVKRLRPWREWSMG